MYLNSCTKITAEKGTIFKLVDNCANFGEQTPIIGQKEDTITCLDISGIEFNGNYSKQSKTPDDHGLGYGNFIGLSNVSDSLFHDLYIHDNEGDGFRIEGGDNLVFMYNLGSMGGHDFCHMNKCSNSRFYDNAVDMRANNVLRLRNCTNVEVANNLCVGTSLAYAPAIQIENLAGTSSDIKIHDNIIQNTYGPGIWLTGQKITDRDAAKNVSI
jgi:Right handed beta helix region